MRTLFCFLLLAVLISSCSYVNQKLGLDNDNPWEEAMEWQIFHVWGIDVDLTQEDPE